MGVVICHLRFNFGLRLCSGCLIWVLNKLPRPGSHLPPYPPLPPSFPCSLPAFFFLLLIPSLLGVRHYSTSKTDSHRQQKKKRLLVFKDELPCSPSTWLQDIVCSCLRATVAFAFSLPFCSESFRVLCFYSRGYLSHKTYMTFLFSSFIKWLCKTGLHQDSELHELKITEHILHGGGLQLNAGCHPWIFW